jgi:hypothetical protein
MEPFLDGRVAGGYHIKCFLLFASPLRSTCTKTSSSEVGDLRTYLGYLVAYSVGPEGRLQRRHASPLNGLNPVEQT